MISASSSQRIIDEAIVETLEFVIAKCEKQRLSVGRDPEYDYDKEFRIRQEGYCGALAWIEDKCSEQINRVRGVLG